MTNNMFGIEQGRQLPGVGTPGWKQRPDRAQSPKSDIPGVGTPGYKKLSFQDGDARESRRGGNDLGVPMGRHMTARGASPGKKRATAMSSERAQ